MRVAHLTALSLSALAVAASGTALAGTGAHPAQPADPSAATSGKQAAMPALTLLPDGLPRKYQSLQSELFTAQSGEQSRGTLDCPIGTVPLGGGVVITSNDVHATVNSSFPNGTSWIADVNNASGTATTFRVFAICSKAPRNYQVVQTPDAAGAAGTQATAFASCPTGTVPYGGGGVSRSPLTSVNLNSTLPSGNSWLVDMNNASSASSDFAAFAICGKKLKGYQQVTGPSQPLGAGATAGSQVTCPGVSLPLGGGIGIATRDVNVNVNSTFPTAGNQWSAFAGNAGSFATSFVARVVCAGV